LGAIKPAEFEKCLLSWILALHEITDGQVIAVDGKTLRRSFDAANSKSAIHMVSAWATANQISLGQVVVDQKSNEITAIPQLLEMLELSGALVTIDAMGCQTEIARQIVAADADYCLAVKGNQPTLHQGIVNFFDNHMEDDFRRTSVRRHQTEEAGHGRKEIRYYFICPVPKDLPDRSRWAGLKAIGIVRRAAAVVRLHWQDRQLRGDGASGLCGGRVSLFARQRALSASELGAGSPSLPASTHSGRNRLPSEVAHRLGTTRSRPVQWGHVSLPGV
jgi:predicted transposase YbfD/YdcC